MRSASLRGRAGSDFAVSREPKRPGRETAGRDTWSGNKTAELWHIDRHKTHPFGSTVLYLRGENPYLDALRELVQAFSGPERSAAARRRAGLRDRWHLLRYRRGREPGAGRTKRPGTSTADKTILKSDPPDRRRRGFHGQLARSWSISRSCAIIAWPIPTLVAGISPRLPFAPGPDGGGCRLAPGGPAQRRAKSSSGPPSHRKRSLRAQIRARLRDQHSCGGCRGPIGLDCSGRAGPATTKICCGTEPMESNIQLLDVVALTVDLPEKALLRCQVGTVVEVMSSDAYEVEFSDDQGRTYAQAALRGDQLMVLHYRPELAA